MGRLLKKISNGKWLVSDGAWGTFLQIKGLKPGDCPELWNIDRFDDVVDIAKKYIEAGSDMVETNSFGANRFKLEYFGLEDRAYELNKAAAEASRAAAGSDVLVLGSIGPTGKFLITGEVTEEELFQAFETQAHGLRNGGADAIIVETMTDIDEAVIAVRAAKSTGLDVVCTMTFDAMPDGSYRSMMGVAPSEMVEPLLEAGADVLGSNCGNGSLGMIDIVREIRETHPTVPILVHANAGLPIYENEQTIFPETPDFMASHTLALAEAGATIIGGCCGTRPEHIQAIRKKMDEKNALFTEEFPLNTMSSVN
jgi:5-methyltetrahydrofolate--homocysteine methyltransferase